MSEDNAYRDLINKLNDGEVVEAIVFGNWGWGGYTEPTPCPLPPEKKGVVMTLDEAKPYMDGWSFNGGYGSPDCYAVNIWTNQRVLWVTQYDGATSLSSAPRNPPTGEAGGLPNMPGG